MYLLRIFKVFCDIYQILLQSFDYEVCVYQQI